MIKIVLLILCISCLSLVFLFVMRKYVFPERFKRGIPKFKGICYFDIDGTLTDHTGNGQAIVQECLDRGYAVGISTASTRRPSDVCTPQGGSKKPWAPENLCKFMADHRFDTYNSCYAPVLAGKEVPISPSYPHTEGPGWLKAYGMTHGMELYGITDPKHVILFDDDPCYIEGVDSYGTDFTVVCAGEHCSQKPICGGPVSGHGEQRLTVELVRKTLDKLDFPQ